MKILILIAIFGLFSACFCEQKRFDGYKVYRFYPENEEQRQQLIQLEKENLEIDFWTHVNKINRPVDVMFPPHLQTTFLRSLKNIKIEENIPDVQKLIDDESRNASNNTKFDWHSYKDLEQIYTWLQSQVGAHPEVATLMNIGETSQRRPTYGVKIAKASDTPKPEIWIDSNIHAREWITGATVTFLIDQLLSSNDPAIIALTEDFDWYIVPIANPDGFVHTKVANRMWRKTRSIITDECMGVDPNRNWDFRWEGVPDGVGGSNEPCSDSYRGPFAASEPELQNLQNTIGDLQNLVMYSAVHSYTQYLLLPYGVPETEDGPYLPDNYEIMENIATKAAVAMGERYKTEYLAGNVIDLLYEASGGSMDWVLSVHPDMILSFAYELRDTGRYGFILPPEQILPTCLEFMDGILVLAEELKTAIKNKKEK